MPRRLLRHHLVIGLIHERFRVTLRRLTRFVVAGALGLRATRFHDGLGTLQVLSNDWDVDVRPQEDRLLRQHELELL